MHRLLFLSRPQRRLFQTGVPVFMYHKIAPVPRGSRDPFLYFTPARFEQQLQALSRLGYKSVPLDAILTAKDNRARQMVVTFDDGSESVFKYALEILARNKVPAIQFIVASLIGKRNEWDVAKGELPDPMMDQAQIREWLAAGHQIGSHTTTHPNLKRVDLATAREEIFGSKKKLEDMFGLSVRHFCYPSGKENQAVRDLVAEAGYLTACTVEFGVNTASTPPMALRRITPLSPLELLNKARHRLIQRFW
jgi:peptidoglycan/xylan/chitin deacetylase (PgdA/CDA1 family)